MRLAPARGSRTARSGQARCWRVLLVAELAWALTRAGRGDGDLLASGPGADPAALQSVRSLGNVLFTEYSLAFEATSILIIVAMVGAVVLARRES